MTIYTVVETEIEKKTGEINHIGVIATCNTREDAQEAMRSEYLAELQKRGLQDNGTSDENGESVPGGYIIEDEAGIYEFTEFAFGQLLQCFMLRVQEITLNQPVNVGDRVFVVAPKLRMNTRQRVYHTKDYEVFEGEVLSVKYDADDVVFAEVLSNRDVETSFGTVCGTRLESYRVGTELFRNEDEARTALKKKEAEDEEDNHESE